MVMAWAWCPYCSPDYPQVRDKRIRVESDQTHTGVMRRCPNCERRVRMSIGAPVLRVNNSRRAS